MKPLQVRPGTPAPGASLLHARERFGGGETSRLVGLEPGLGELGVEFWEGVPSKSAWDSKRLQNMAVNR